MVLLLLLAGVYNILWGALAVFFPLAMFQWAGMAPLNYIEFWQWIGMVAGVFGLGYLIASAHPLRHWPIVFAGFLEKIFGSIGFLLAARAEHLPWTFGWMIVTNDLWLVPFALILFGAYKAHRGTRRASIPEIRRMALRAKSQYGISLDEHSRLSPVLMVFLRHFGCTFCREALRDIARNRGRIESNGTCIVLVHMSKEKRAEDFLRLYGLVDVPRVSDPGRSIYRAFGLERGRFFALFGPKVWWRGIGAGLFGGHGAGRVEGDGFQMPGMFLVFHGVVLRSYHHLSAADRPDYVKFVSQDLTMLDETVA
jgi:AhpC/TSA family